MTKVVLYHDDADGFGAAYAVWTHDRWTLQPEDRLYIPVNYGQPVPELPVDTTSLVIVDFSYDRATCDALATKYPHFLVIDHHKTAQEALAGAPYAVFDLGLSGAVLTWNYFNAGRETLPDILRYVQDRDLWRWELPSSDEVNMYIATLSRDFATWDGFDLQEALGVGHHLKKYRDKLVEKMVSTAFVDSTGGITGAEHLRTMAVVFSPILQSEVGNELCKRYPDVDFAAAITITSWGEGRVSLRSVGEVDVSEIARKNGGGGHKNAAGFNFKE